MHAVRITKPPVLDGKLDDAAWQQAPANEGFTQKFPDENKPPSERTRLRILFDARAIYVGVSCDARHTPVVARMTRRDRPIEADWVSVSLDTRGDGTTAFEFVVNAAGVLTDGVRFDDTQYSTDWDENWDARTHVTPQGWTAELRIPLRILRYDASKKAQVWGLQVRRYVSGRQETDEWAFIPRAASGEVSRYGRLHGLTNLSKTTPIELRPFVVGRVLRRDRGTFTLAEGTSFGGSGGLDLKWHLTPNLTMDLALNPDFGQVEADQIVFNLSNFEVFYPEKRPFFLEGYDTFATPFFRLLYTRRIGQPANAPALRDGEQLVDIPLPPTIYGAAKLVGNLGARLTLGVLSAVTGRGDAPVLGASGQEDRLAAPTSTFNVLRLKAKLGTNAHAGLHATAVHRLESADASVPSAPGREETRLCPSGDLVARGERCFHDAYTGGFDLRWRSPGGEYVAAAQGVGSLRHGGPGRTQRDGVVFDSGALGGGAMLYVAKEGGAPWIWNFGYDGASRKLDLNDAGYLQRANYHSIWGEVGFRRLAPWWKTLETTTKLGFWQNLNWDGQLLESGLYGGSVWKLDSFWTLAFESRFIHPYYDDREVGDGTALQHERGLWVALRVFSDPRKVVSGELMGGTFRRPNGDFFQLSGRLTLRFHPQLDLELLPDVNYSYGEPRYVGSGDAPDELRFGRLLGRSIGTAVRATYTFTPRLSLQAFAQLYLASFHYTDFTLWRRPPGATRGEVRLRDLRAAAAPDQNPDAQEGTLNVNVVLRWEYLLGSTLFVVYSRAQAPSRTLRPGESAGLDLSALRGAPASDVFMVKLSYWWG